LYLAPQQNGQQQFLSDEETAIAPAQALIGIGAGLKPAPTVAPGQPAGSLRD
jgi:hypothetical protein